MPRRDQAILELTDALERLSKFQFPPMLNEVTRAQFAVMSKLESVAAADLNVGLSRPKPAA